MIVEGKKWRTYYNHIIRQVFRIFLHYNIIISVIMNYSRFSTTIDLTTELEIKKRRDAFIKQHVEKNKLILLKCDYFGVDSYYYNHHTKTLYKVCNVYNKYTDSSSIEPNFEVSNDTHILSLNNLLF